MISGQYLSYENKSFLQFGIYFEGESISRFLFVFKSSYLYSIRWSKLGRVLREANMTQSHVPFEHGSSEAPFSLASLCIWYNLFAGLLEKVCYACSQNVD